VQVMRFAFPGTPRTLPGDDHDGVLASATRSPEGACAENDKARGQALWIVPGIILDGAGAARALVTRRRARALAPKRALAGHDGVGRDRTVQRQARLPQLHVSGGRPHRELSDLYPQSGRPRCSATQSVASERLHAPIFSYP
jgi:hypothetical protein